ncbi:MAG TPA: polymorphic toxin-type HINT domain-containing protein [Pirellulaceae bacterium]|nr:polymorphic toxin-type HINT domain-containing protein [Pirellulaceae bacterium]
MVRTLARAKVAIGFAPVFAIVVFISASAVWAETKRESRLAAAADVKEALQREIYGLTAERESLLLAAAKRAPTYAPARWHLGHVQDARKRWMSADDFIEQCIGSRNIKLYEAARQKAADTIEGQLTLAEYCRREGLDDQMRAALTRVLEIDPNHEGARAALGFVRMGPLWLSRAEMEAEEALARAEEESVSRWRSDMEEFAKAFASESTSRRAAAKGRLLSLHDSSAIAAMERIVSPVSDEAALAVIGTLSESRDLEASLSLARHAVLYPSLPVREAAADALARRDLHSYVPSLVNMMTTPIESRVASTPLPGGTIGFRQVFRRDTFDRQDVLVLDTEYERFAQPGGSRAGARGLAAADARNTAGRRVLGAERQNDLTLRLNERIAWVLNRATQQELPPSAETWWQWWNDQNERLADNQKTQAVSQVYRRVQIIDPVPVMSIGSGIQTGGGGGECLVAGTLVWTASGPTAVERVNRGDLVLSQDVETGELSFKPVLRTTTRPVGKIVKFTAGPETFECSGGHVFWVAGEGWRKASQLESGMLLHTASGPAPIVSVETGSDAATYNLIVADFATYFVGQQKILSHDFTLRRATSAVVPGLKPE